MASRLTETTSFPRVIFNSCNFQATSKLFGSQGCSDDKNWLDFFITFYIKQIDSMSPFICSVIDHRRGQNVVRTSVTHSAIASCATFLFLPHFDVICDLLLNRRTATWPDHDKLHFDFYVFMFSTTTSTLKKMFLFFKARAEKGIARHIDASSVVWNLIDNGKLANQIASLAAIVMKIKFPMHARLVWLVWHWRVSSVLKVGT